MTTKLIYVMVNGRPEKAEFQTDCPAQDVKDLFRAAAEAGPHDILKMYNSKGNVVNISPQLAANDPQSYYNLEVVVASDYHSERQGTGQAMTSELDTMEKRLHGLERDVFTEAETIPGIVCELKSQVDSFQRKLEGVEHLSWLGLFKDLSGRGKPSLDLLNSEERYYKPSPHLLKSEGRDRPSLNLFKRPPANPQEERQTVRAKFLQMSSLEVSEEVRKYLRTPMFNNWQWEEAEMLVLLQVMYTDLDFLSMFNMELEVLQNFLYEVYCHYNNIPFHNFRHCFCVTQMMYGLIWLTDLKNKMDSTDLLILLTSALCHDLDHTGYNNAYQINAQTELALRYNDISPLENHHCAIAFEILAKTESNIFRNLTSEQYKRIRKGMIKCILATDMAKHNEILFKFKAMLPVFDFSDKDHKDVLMKILIKVSDISNEARPVDVAEPWLDCLLQEFFHQSDMEKLKGLPVTPFMDRDKVSKPSSQTGFIRFVLFPLYTELSNLFPCLEQHIIDPVHKALDYYTEMGKAFEEEHQKPTPD